MKSFCVAVTLIFISALPVYAGKWATGTTAPATCTVGDSWTDTNGTADNRFYTCTATNTWTLNSNQTAIDAKANKSATVMLWSEWGDGSSFTTSSPPVAYNGAIYKCIAPYTKTSGEYPDTQTEYFAEVTGSGSGIAHATSDGAYYASRNGAWASLAGVFAAPLGSDDNYVTDAEKVQLGNLSGYALTSSVLSKNNTTAFTPTADYHPSTKKYVDDSITTSGGYTDEQAQDAAGAMFSGNTETGITVTYDDATGEVNFAVPTTLAGFTDDATHRLVTDTEKSTWNAKQNALVAGTDYLTPTGSAANLTGFPSSLATDTEVSTGYQPLDADLTDLADGSLTGSKIGTGIAGGNISTGTVADARIDAAIARDTEVTAAINALPALVFGTGLTTSTDTPSAGTDTVSVTANTYQAYDLDLTTWAGVTPGTGVAAFIASPSGGNLATALTTALPASKGGTGLNAIGTGVPTALGINTGAVGGLPTIIASGAYTVDTASISANTCASAVAVTASGVATTDTIIATPNAILSSVAGFGVTTAGAVRVDIYPTSGNVNFQFCNPTGAAINPGSVTFNWKVVR